MLEEAQSLTLKAFNGLYRKGAPENVPPDHFVDSLNLFYQPGSFGIRPGTSFRQSIGLPVTSLAEWVTDTLPHPIVSIDTSGKLRLNNSSTVLYTQPGAKKLHTINFFGKLFICACEDYSLNPIGNLLMLYNSSVLGANTLREAGGDPPTPTAQMAAADGTPASSSSNLIGSPTVGTQIVGADEREWNNISNAFHGGYATCTLYGSNSSVNTSNTLILKGFTGFETIPDNATIDGIKVSITHEQFDGTSAVYDATINLVGVYAAAKTSIVPWASSGAETVTYGNSTELWGGAFSGSDIKSPDFGVSIINECTLLPGNGASIGIDGVTVQVWYTVSAGGNVEAGDYNITVAYLTDTGFITPAATSPKVAIKHTAAGSKTIVLTNVPTGPSYIVGRYILVSQIIAGSPTLYYFVPESGGGFLNNNTATTTTIDFFLTDLIDSADYLFNIRARIPAGLGLITYSGRLALWGFDSPDSSILRVSNTSEYGPETFDKTLETIIVSKDDGYPVTNAAIIRDVLYIWKLKGIYDTKDNGADPVNWPVELVDSGVGTGYMGISTLSPSIEHAGSADLLIFSDIAGAYIFNGVVQQPELSWKVSDLWSAEDVLNLSVVVDFRNKTVYFSNFDESSPLKDFILVGSWDEGISSQAIKWDIWKIPSNYDLIIYLFTNLLAQNSTDVCFLQNSSSSSGNIVKLDSSVKNDYIDGITTSGIHHFAVFSAKEVYEGGINILRGVKIRGTGKGLLHISVSDEFQTEPNNRSPFEDLHPPILTTAPKREYTVYSRFMSESLYLRFEAQPPDSTQPIDTTAYFVINKVIVYADGIYAERPSQGVHVNP